MFIGIATKLIQPSQVTTYLKLKRESYVDSVIKKSVNKKKNQLANQAVLVKGESNILCNLSSCCSPLPGDRIIGYITQGKGIKVHRIDCPNVQKDKSRLIDVEWNPNYQASSCPVDIQIKATDRDNLIIDVLNLLAQNKITCSKLITKLHPDTGTVSIQITINVNNIDSFINIRNQLMNISNVYSVERLTH